MFRTVLSAVLTFATLAGQSVCCCAWAGRCVAAAPAAEKTAPCCCRHTSHQRHDDGRSAPVPRCPCREQRSPASVAPVSDADSAAYGTLSLDALADTVSLMPNATASSAAPDRGSAAWPFFSGRDILRALHVFRC